ncbi:MAG: bifunctional glutamate N-acetyltransferase/amino-acid acetyltransferase ArgJ [Actinomycetota bacterium]|nr:bifunctional glutamate N-acetyltransferase/amino-acid acetyltransferase ArgJ [Actinomycetota bacterium]
MSITYPKGFRAAGITAGFKPSGRADLGLLFADGDAIAAAGVFTTNAFAAAPVRLCRERLGDGRARAIVVNSGQANAGTGPDGDDDAFVTSAAAARALRIPPEEVLPCSTGVIGARIPVQTFTAALPKLVGALSPGGGNAFAESIMTTDTVPKMAHADTGPYRVGGCAKGVGMIRPDLATMLTFVTTDAPVSSAHLRVLTTSILEPAFESLTVDGCSSTNDTVLLLASGAAGGDPVRPDTPEWRGLEAALGDVATSLLSQLAGDAEGVNHVLEVSVYGAATDEDARVVARAIAESLLVKTAAFGGDPNPGRFLQAIGSSGVAFEPGDVHARLGDVVVIRNGAIPPDFETEDNDAARAVVKAPEIPISVELGRGPGSARMLGCDLSYEYVRINAEYTT